MWESLAPLHGRISSRLLGFIKLYLGSFSLHLPFYAHNLYILYNTQSMNAALLNLYTRKKNITHHHNRIPSCLLQFAHSTTHSGVWKLIKEYEKRGIKTRHVSLAYHMEKFRELGMHKKQLVLQSINFQNALWN